MVIRIGSCGWSYDHWQAELYAPGLPAARPAGSLRGCLPHGRVQQQLLPLAPGHRRSATWRQKLPDGFRLSVKAPRGFSLRVAVRGRATCRVLEIDVRHTAARQAVSQHDAVTTDYELTDAGLVAACAGFDD